MSEQYGVLYPGARRQGADRRQANLRSLIYALFMGRRHGQRRTNEDVISYIDYYGHFTFAVALTLMLFCIADAYFTLQLLRYGSTELNPILAWALQKHALYFFLLKYTVTAFSVVVAVMHQNFRLFGLKGLHFLLGGLVGYACLIAYQLSMLLPFWLYYPQ